MKNIVIIGAGHNGLVCACYLAAAGARVTMLERRAVVGGAAVTEAFHPGFRNSVASYTVSLLHPRIISDLRLHAHGLRILSRRVNNYLPLPDGDAFTAWPDADRLKLEVGRFSSRDAAALTRYSELLGSIVPVVKDIMLMTPPALTDFSMSDVFKLFKLSWRYQRLDDRHKRFLLKLFAVSAGEMLDDLFETDAIKALFGFDAVVGHYASPYAPGSAYVLLHHVVGEVNGNPGTWGHAVGGMGAITQAMAKQAQALGVNILTDRAVDEVQVRHGAACGVRTEDGAVFAADLVVANVNPKLLYCQLLDEALVAPDTLAHFNAYKCQSGTFRMNVALDRLPRFSSSMPEHCLEGGIIMAPSLDYMDSAFTDAKRRGWSARPIVEMLIPSIVDDSLAPPGKHVASLFCQQFDPGLGAMWDENRDAAAGAILDTVDGFAPGFRQSVIATEVHTPWDLEEKFGMTGGDIFHGRLSLDQLFSARPMLGMGQYRTDIDQLWLCGAGTHPGGGVSGIPGYNAAREIIRHLRRL